MQLGRFEMRAGEGFFENFRLADFEAAALIELGGFWVEFKRRVPEGADEARAFGIIPDERGDGAAGVRDPAKFV